MRKERNAGEKRNKKKPHEDIELTRCCKEVKLKLNWSKTKTKAKKKG